MEKFSDYLKEDVSAKIIMLWTSGLAYAIADDMEGLKKINKQISMLKKKMKDSDIEKLAKKAKEMNVKELDSVEK